MSAKRRNRYERHGFSNHEDYLEAVWKGRLSDLKAFKRRFGHARVPQKWSEDLPLERWVRRQRELYRIGDLRQDRYEKLVKLGFVFDIANPARFTWEQRFQELVAYRRRFGDTRVPQAWAESPGLSRWVATQRRAALKPDRRRRLERFGFEWTIRPSINWEDMYARLRAFRRAHGHTDVSPRHEDPRLCNWVSRQRMLAESGRLEIKRRVELERIGFRFRLSRRVRTFEQGLAELRALRRKSPRNGVYWQADPGLSTWVSNLRKRVDQLSRKQKSDLEKLGVVFGVLDKRWEELYERLLRFHQKKGHSHVPSTFPDDPVLARWVVKQRVRYRSGTMDPKRAKRLKGIGLFRERS